MPNSHFTGSVNAVGDYEAMESAWAAFLAGAVGSGIVIEGASRTNTVDNPIAVGAPEVSGDGEGYDAIAAIPEFSIEPGVTYRLRYSDDGLVSFSDTGYEAAPNSQLTFPNGWHAGRQFSIFANDVPGTVTDPLY